jgi:hypothetical protein
VGQNDGSAHHLVGMPGVDTQSPGPIDCFVKLGELHLLQQSDRFRKRIRRLGYSRTRLRNILAGFSHQILVSHRSCQPLFGEPGGHTPETLALIASNRSKSRGAIDGPELCPEHIDKV